MTSTATRVRYFGRVQGVGFRRRAEGVARQYKLGGYVRNLADGSVELLAEGPPAAVEACLARISAALAAEIDRAETTPEPPAGYTAFAILPTPNP